MNLNANIEYSPTSFKCTSVNLSTLNVNIHYVQQLLLVTIFD